MCLGTVGAGTPARSRQASIDVEGLLGHVQANDPAGNEESVARGVRASTAWVPRLRSLLLQCHQFVYRRLNRLFRKSIELLWRELICLNPQREVMKPKKYVVRFTPVDA